MKNTKNVVATTSVRTSIPTEWVKKTSSLSEKRFMYNSVPGVRRAAMTLEDIDPSRKNASGQFHGSRRLIHSIPAEFKRPRTHISFYTIISFKAHPGVVIEEDLLDDDAFFQDVLTRGGLGGLIVVWPHWRTYCTSCDWYYFHFNSGVWEDCVLKSYYDMLKLSTRSISMNIERHELE